MRGWHGCTSPGERWTERLCAALSLSLSLRLNTHRRKVTVSADKKGHMLLACHGNMPWSKYSYQLSRGSKIVLDGGRRAFVSPDLSFTNDFAADGGK